MDEKKFEQAENYHYIINTLKKIISDINDDSAISIEAYKKSLWVPIKTELPKEINKELIGFFKAKLKHYEELFKSL